MSKTKSKLKTSIVWNFFVEKPGSTELAICKLCSQNLNYKSTSNNLKKHLQRKHPTVKLDDDRSLKCSISASVSVAPVNSVNANDGHDSDVPLHTLQPNMEMETMKSTAEKPIIKQTTVTQYAIKRKMGISVRKKIDDALLLLFVKDFQPFSVVEDTGFRKFVEDLNPPYQLPSRKTITETLLPAAYEAAYNELKNVVRNFKGITITTDCWTSKNTKNFFAVTGYFINEDFEVRSVLLDCSAFGDSHTSENLAFKLNDVINEWDLKGKVIIAVSDNAVNIKKAISENLRLKHLGWYAHTLNLDAQDALSQLNALLDKVKTIVGHFERSSVLIAKFLNQQKQQWHC